MGSGGLPSPGVRTVQCQRQSQPVSVYWLRTDLPSLSLGSSWGYTSPRGVAWAGPAARRGRRLQSHQTFSVGCGFGLDRPRAQTRSWLCSPPRGPPPPPSPRHSPGSASALAQSTARYQGAAPQPQAGLVLDPSCPHPLPSQGGGSCSVTRPVHIPPSHQPWPPPSSFPIPRPQRVMCEESIFLYRECILKQMGEER